MANRDPSGRGLGIWSVIAVIHCEKLLNSYFSALYNEGRNLSSWASPNYQVVVLGVMMGAYHGVASSGDVVVLLILDQTLVEEVPKNPTEQTIARRGGENCGVHLGA